MVLKAAADGYFVKICGLRSLLPLCVLALPFLSVCLGRAALILGDIEVLHTEGHPGNSRLTLHCLLSYYSLHCPSAIYHAILHCLCNDFVKQDSIVLWK